MRLSLRWKHVIRTAMIICGSGRDTVVADRDDVLRGCERAFRR